MSKKIAFIGGIHGVGKSTICHQICELTHLRYISASELIKWNEINDDVNNKNVKSIPETQDRLIYGLEMLEENNEGFLLDGHYCLLNKKNEVIDVPIETFIKIAPYSLSIIIGDIKKIKERLELRDGREYSESILHEMQNRELEYARQLSQKLGVKLYVGDSENYSIIIDSLKGTNSL
jgi:adenylate kinase